VQLEIAVILVRGEVEAIPVIHELAVFHAPIFLDVVQAGFALLRALLARHGEDRARVLGAHPVPPRQILAVENGGEASGGISGGRRRGERKDHGERGGGERDAVPVRHGSPPWFGGK
jgi:hypothetical protein